MDEFGAVDASSSAAEVPSGVVAAAVSEGPVPCPTCAANPPAVAAASVVSSLVYAIGRIEPRFPSLSVEKELAQATGRAETVGLTDSAALREVLSAPENRYLVRQLCWTFVVGGLETYVLAPQDPQDFDLLVASVRETPEPTDLDIVIGVRAGVAPPSMCNGMTLPIVAFHQIYSFDRASLLAAVPKPAGAKGASASAAAGEVFDRILHVTGNTGASAAHRALNYLAVRFPGLYAQTAEAFANDQALTAVDVRPAALSSARDIVSVIITYTNRSTGVESKYFVRVDVTEAFPFALTSLAPYYETP